MKRSGHRIDCDKTPTLGNGTKDAWNDTICETPPQNMATIVTVYYNMRSKQPTHEYKRWMPNMLQAMDPVIICDPTSAIDNTLPLYWYGGTLLLEDGCAQNLEREDYTNADARGHSQESI